MAAEVPCLRSRLIDPPLYAWATSTGAVLYGRDLAALERRAEQYEGLIAVCRAALEHREPHECPTPPKS